VGMEEGGQLVFHFVLLGVNTAHTYIKMVLLPLSPSPQIK
jgi:hypothetical protein